MQLGCTEFTHIHGHTRHTDVHTFARVQSHNTHSHTIITPQQLTKTTKNALRLAESHSYKLGRENTRATSSATHYFSRATVLQKKLDAMTNENMETKRKMSEVQKQLRQKANELAELRKQRKQKDKQMKEIKKRLDQKNKVCN